MPTTLEKAWPKPAARHVSTAVERLVNRFNPRRIMVFGSYARGEALHGSDLDLMVVLDQVDSKREAAIEMRRTLAGLGIPLDVYVTTPDEIEQRGWIIGTLIHEVLQRGMEVYRRDGDD